MMLFERVRDWLAAGEAVALATVVRVAGSTPRHPGAKMAVTAGGETAGTIGGGRVELEATRAAMQVAAGGEGRVVTHHLVRDLAMCCGGSMELAITPLGDSAATVAEAAELLRRRQPLTLVAPVAGPLSIERGASGAPRWDGERWIEPLHPPERVILFGAGHVGRALGELAARAGFEVVACDDNETGALDGGEPAWADRTIHSFEAYDVRAALGALGPRDFALVMTRDHAIDQRLVEALLPEPELGYLGLIGSRGKIGRFRKRILAKGIVDEAGWARLRAPIGLDIGAETPVEIAVAVVAELIAERARRRGGGGAA